MATMTQTLPDLRRVEQFLFREAMYLDRKLFDEWLGLFTEDGLYWAPLVHGQASHEDHVSLYIEDALARAMRVKRLRNPSSWSLQPVNYTARSVTNVMLEGIEEKTGDVVVASVLHVIETRGPDFKRVQGALVTHHLAPFGDSFRIRLKKIELTDCEEPQDALQGFL